MINIFVTAESRKLGRFEKGLINMLISKENHEIKGKIFEFDNRIDEMHLDFYKYYHGLETKMPDWERLENELIFFSRKKITDLILSNNLDRILYKFQNRKKIWLSWVEKYHHTLDKKTTQSNLEENINDN